MYLVIFIIVNYTVEKLAKRVNISPELLKNIEENINLASDSQLTKISEVLNMEIIP